MQLSANFTFEELTSTGRTNLLAINREAALNDPVIINNLKILATKVLQPIRDFYSKPPTAIFNVFDLYPLVTFTGLL